MGVQQFVLRTHFLPPTGGGTLLFSSWQMLTLIFGCLNTENANFAPKHTCHYELMANKSIFEHLKKYFQPITLCTYPRFVPHTITIWSHCTRVQQFSRKIHTYFYFIFHLQNMQVNSEPVALFLFSN